MSEKNTSDSEAKLTWQENKARQAALRKKANELKKLEDKIEKLENNIAEIDEQFSLPENATNSSLLNELTSKRNALQSELDEAYEKWEEMSE